MYATRREVQTRNAEAVHLLEDTGMLGEARSRRRARQADERRLLLAAFPAEEKRLLARALSMGGALGKAEQKLAEAEAQLRAAREAFCAANSVMLGADLQVDNCRGELQQALARLADPRITSLRAWLSAAAASLDGAIKAYDYVVKNRVADTQKRMTVSNSSEVGAVRDRIMERVAACNALLAGEYDGLAVGAELRAMHAATLKELVTLGVEVRGVRGEEATLDLED